MNMNKIIAGVLLALALAVAWHLFTRETGTNPEASDTPATQTQDSPSEATPGPATTTFACDPTGTLIVAQQTEGDSVLSIDFMLAGDGLRETLPLKDGATNEYEAYGALVVDNGDAYTVTYADTTYTCTQAE